MSTYGINKVLYLFDTDAAFLERFRANPKSALADQLLDDAEREELASGDVAALYRRGINAYLLLHFVRCQLMPMEQYRERILALRPESGP
jgi:hypothetical protein